MSRNRVVEIKIRRRFPPALRRRLLIRTLMQSVEEDEVYPLKKVGDMRKGRGRGEDIP
jgi:hypothetical protein